MALSPELKNKTKKELIRMLAQLRLELREPRFKVATRELKDVRRVRKIRKKIAHILTLINMKKE